MQALHPNKSYNASVGPANVQKPWTKHKVQLILQGSPNSTCCTLAGPIGKNLIPWPFSIINSTWHAPRQLAGKPTKGQSLIYPMVPCTHLW